MSRKWNVKRKGFIAKLMMIAGTAAVIGIALRNYDDIGDDLLLNLAAEALVIVWSYFTIDRIIRRRREKQLEPARCLLYARLLEMIDQFLQVTLPEEFRETSIKKYKYRHGEIYAISTLEPPDQETLSRLPKLIKRDIENRGPFYREPLSQFREELDAALDRSLTLLDAELMNPLLRLSFVYLGSIPVNEARASYWLTGVIAETIDVRTKLQHKVDQHFSPFT